MTNQIVRLPIFIKTRKQRPTKKNCDFCYKGFRPLEMRYSYNKWSITQGKDWFNYHRDCYRVVILESIIILKKEYNNNGFNKQRNRTTKKTQNQY